MPDPRITVVLLLAVFACACGIIGPTCVGRQQRGTVANLSGETAPGQIAVHLVPYGTQGSQNDVRMTWAGQTSAGGPRLELFATRASCASVTLPPESNTGDCAIVARAPSASGAVVSSLIVTHGRGNPEQLGTPPQFKLWIVGDPQQRATYAVEITWFYGPDC